MVSNKLEDKVIPAAVSLLTTGILAMYCIAANMPESGQMLQREFQRARAGFEKVEPYIKRINGAAELAAMASFGVWDPEWKPHK